MISVTCPYCGDATEQDFLLERFTCGKCDEPFDWKSDMTQEHKYGVWVYIAGHQGWAKGAKNLSYADAVTRADTLGRQDVAAVVKPMPNDPRKAMLS